MHLIYQVATSATSISDAMVKANKGLREQLETVTGDLENISISHSSGFAPSGFFVTIMATVPKETFVSTMGAMMNQQ